MKDISELVKKYPDKPWSWDYLTVNHNIKPKFILENRHLPWNEQLLLSNPNIDLKFVEKNLNKFDWCANKLSRIATEEFILKYPHIEYVWGIGGLSNNPNITFEFVKKFIDKRWDFSIHGLSRNSNMGIQFFKFFQNEKVDPSLNPNITIEVINFFKTRLTFTILSKYINPEIVEYYISDTEYDFNWEFGATGLSSNVNLTCDFVGKYINRKWDWGIINIDFEKIKHLFKRKIWTDISSNPYLTVKFINDNIDNLSILELSSNVNITDDIVRKHISKRWAWNIYGLSDNPSITPGLVSEFSKKDWYFPSLSGHLDFKFIILNPKYNWNKRKLNSNCTIKLEYMKEFEPNFVLLSLNKNISFEIVDKYINEKWNWSELSR
jgi:hypothetical protein